MQNESHKNQFLSEEGKQYAYVVGDVAYHFLINIFKIYSQRFFQLVHKKQFMTLWIGGVKIKNAFAHSKNRWRVLKNMNLSIL